MGGEDDNPESALAQELSTDEVKILCRTISEWVESPAPDRAMIADHIYWTWYGKTYPKPQPAPQQQDVSGNKQIQRKFKAPSKRWWIESP